MKLTKKTKYALDAIFFIYEESKKGDEGTRLSAKEIASKLNLSVPFLSLVMRELRISKILKSKKGPGGGYLLGENFNSLTLNNILESINETIKLNQPEQNHSLLCQRLEIQLQKEMDNLADKPLIDLL